MYIHVALCQIAFNSRPYQSTPSRRYIYVQCLFLLVINECFFAWMQAFLFLQILQSTSYIHFIATQLQVDSASCLRQKISCLYMVRETIVTCIWIWYTSILWLAVTGTRYMWLHVDSTAYSTYSSQFIWRGHNLSLEVIIAKWPLLKLLAQLGLQWTTNVSTSLAHVHGTYHVYTYTYFT